MTHSNCASDNRSFHSVVTGGVIASFLLLSFISLFSMPASSQSIVTISSDTTLSSNVSCVNLVVDSGAILTTDGYSIICSGTVTNEGTIMSGYPNNGGLVNGDGQGTSYPNSYGGSGGGGGYNAGGGSFGGSTRAPGGSPGTAGVGAGNGGSGTTPSAPILDNALIQQMFSGGMINYLTGAGGGAGQPGAGQAPQGDGGSGAYGLFIQANAFVNNGVLNAAGQTAPAAPNEPNDASGGGGGGGVILIAYGSGGLTIGSINVTGGAGGYQGAGSTGGNGGAGQLLTFSYGNNPPVTVNSVTSNANIQSTSTSANGTLVPGYAFDGAYAKYNYIVTYFGASETIPIIFEISNVNAAAQTFSLSTLFTGNYAGLSSNITATFSNPGLPVITSGDLALLNKGLLPSDLSLIGTSVLTGQKVSVPAGTFTTDEILTNSSGSGGIYIDQKSGLIIKESGVFGFTTALLPAGTGETIELTSTNIPSSNSSATSSLLLIVAIVAVVIVALGGISFFMVRRRKGTKSALPQVVAGGTAVPVPVGVAAPSAAPTTPTQGVSFCPKCGNQISADESFCNRCGNRKE